MFNNIIVIIITIRRPHNIIQDDCIRHYNYTVFTIQMSLKI